MYSFFIFTRDCIAYIILNFFFDSAPDQEVNLNFIFPLLCHLKNFKYNLLKRKYIHMIRKVIKNTMKMLHHTISHMCLLPKGNQYCQFLLYPSRNILSTYKQTYTYFPLFVYIVPVSMHSSVSLLFPIYCILGAFSLWVHGKLPYF